MQKKWTTWKDEFHLFIIGSGVTRDAQKKALLLHIAGKEVREIYRSLDPDPNDLSYERYVFKKATQLVNGDTAADITRLKR